MAKRTIIRIEVLSAAKRRIEELSKKTGMTQVTMTSRLYEWFAEQSELIQAAVLGAYPKEFQAEIAAIILKKMSNAPDADDVKQLFGDKL